MHVCVCVCVSLSVCVRVCRCMHVNSYNVIIRSRFASSYLSEANNKLRLARPKLCVWMLHSDYIGTEKEKDQEFEDHANRGLVALATANGYCYWDFMALVHGP